MSESERWAASAPQGCGGRRALCWIGWTVSLVGCRTEVRSNFLRSGIGWLGAFHSFAREPPVWRTQDENSSVRRDVSAGRRSGAQPPLLLWLWSWMDLVVRVSAVLHSTLLHFDQAPGPPCFDKVSCGHTLRCVEIRWARVTTSWRIVRDLAPRGLEFVAD